MGIDQLEHGFSVSTDFAPVNMKRLFLYKMIFYFLFLVFDNP